MKIKDLPKNQSLEGVQFKHPHTHETVIWFSQWGYLPPNKAGIWFKKINDPNPAQIYPLPLDDLKEALEFEVISTSL